MRVKCLVCLELLNGVHQRLYLFMEIQLFDRKKIRPKNPRGSSVVSELKACKGLFTHTFAHTHHIVKTVSCCSEPFCPLSLPCLYRNLGWCLWWQRSLSTNNVVIEKRILPLLSLEPPSPLQVYMTLQLLSTEAVEFCSTASLRAYKEALLPGFSNQLSLTAFWQIMWETAGHNNNASCGNMR